MILRPLLCGAAALLLFGCSQAEVSHNFNYGQSARITCYSGNLLTLDDFSTGRVESESGSDGWHYVSQTTGRLLHAAGACYIDYGVNKPAEFHAVLPPVKQP